MKIANYYEDIQKPHVNTLPDRAYFIPFESSDEACRMRREQSSRMQLLNGSWKFAWYSSVDQVADDFYAAEFDSCEMDNIDVPGCWQPQGYDKYHYVGAKHIIPVDPPYVPVDNPCGTYVTDFCISADEAVPVTELVFEGVDSCFYVWMNGQFVGYSEVSHAISMFDVTPYLKNGKNRLAVLNLKWSTGTYFEIQDKWRMTGIFRDVYLLRRPQVRLEDFYIHQNIADDYSEVVLNTDFTFIGEGGTFRVKVLDPNGDVVDESEAEIAPGASTIHRIQTPKLWSAETPTLYTMVIELPGEVVAQKVGIRKITVEQGMIKINGNRIRIKGVNRHDTDPVTAYTVSRAHILRDLTLMKQNNINAIRTAHYQNSPIVIEMCNELGLYVLSEADYETHGIAYSGGAEAPIPPGEKAASGASGYHYYCPIINDDPLYEIAGLDRMKKNPIRDKNQGSVIIWSLGNESGWGRMQELGGAWIKKYDPTRLLHYENLFPGYTRKPDYSCLDVMSRMYPSIYWIQEKYGDLESYDESVELLPNSDDATEAYYKEFMKEHPFLLCEFIHAMGNSSGDAEDYFEMMEKYERFVGGFVWEWADHAKYVGDDRSGKPMYQYGGDSGEYPTDGNFCMDGMNFPDRRPHTSLKEYKNVIRPIRARWGVQNKTVILRNMLNVVDMKDELNIHYELYKDGKVIERKQIEVPSCAPWSEVEVSLDLKVPESGVCYLNLLYTNKKENAAVPADFDLGFDQLEVDTVKPEVSPWFVPSEAAGALAMRETDKVVLISGVSSEGTFEYTFDKKLGNFKFMKINGQQLLDRPMEYNVFRAPTDNDRGFGMVYKRWVEIGYNAMITRIYEVSTELKEHSAEIKVSFGMAAVYRTNVLKATATWTVSEDGSIALNCAVNRNTDFIYLPRFGVRMFLKKDAGKKITYFGYGPHESYVDKHHSCYKALFETDVDELFEDYVRPQENGSHWDVSYLNVGEQEGPGIQVLPGGESFSFNVSRYTQEVLEETKHNYELVPTNSTVVCLDYMQSGIGSNSCGPELLDKYQLKDSEFTFSIKILPRF